MTGYERQSSDQECRGPIGLSREACRPFGDPKTAQVFVIGHDPRLQRSDAQAETVFFLDYLDRPKPSVGSEARKYELAEAAVEYVRELTGGQVPLEQMYFTNLCNEFLPHPQRGGTVLIPDHVADRGLAEILRALDQGRPRVIIPMSLQVFYHLARSGFVEMDEGKREAFLRRAAAKPVDRARRAYVQSSPRAFLDVCGRQFLHRDTPVVPVVHVKAWPVRGSFLAYQSAMQNAAANIRRALAPVTRVRFGEAPMGTT